MKLLMSLIKFFIIIALILGILSTFLIILIIGTPVCILNGMTFRELFIELNQNLSDEIDKKRKLQTL